MKQVEVVAAVLSTTNLTLYKRDGQTIIIPQGDKRIVAIMESIEAQMPPASYATIDLEADNTYKDFEEKSSGLTKFFRVAKKFVAHIFSDAPENTEKLVPKTIGSVPTKSEPEEAKPTPAPTKMRVAVADILAHATPAKSEEFTALNNTSSGSEDTIIAVTNGKIIPEVENLSDHIDYAAKMGNTVGVEKFLSLLSEVIDKRGHSVKDLLRFMQRNDMPIADDGFIIAYKRLKKHNKQNTFVDCHSGNVLQGLGSRVFMDESMVDHDRRHDCSNGLHIARRAYIGGFSGNVIVIVKIDPRDVIAVPQYDSNKMRVCGYNIVAVVPEVHHNALIANKPFTTDGEMAKLTGAVISGKHVDITETVEIGGSRGGNLKITRLVEGNAEQLHIAEKEAEAAQATPQSVLDDPVNSVNAIDPKAVADKVAAKKAATAAPKKKAPVKKPSKPVKKPEPVQVYTPAEPKKVAPKKKPVTEKPKLAVTPDDLLQTVISKDNKLPVRLKAAEDLLALKKKKKVSWAKLNLPDNTTEVLQLIISGKK